MKQSLCVISEYNKDYSLIHLLQNSAKYNLKAILLTNTFEPSTFQINDVTILNNAHAEYLGYFDAIYISNNCTQNSEKYLQIARNNSKLINLYQHAESITCLSHEYYGLNIPIFVIMGSHSDCEKNKVIVQMLHSLTSQSEKIAVISNYENNDLLGYYRFPVDKINNCKTINERILMINNYIHEVIQKSHCTALLLSIPGGVCNPFFPYDCESSILSYMVSKACSIDYLIYILPGNMWSEPYLNTINHSVSSLVTKTIDYWILSSQIFDSPYFDNATNTNDIPKITLSENTMNKIYNSCFVERSSIVNSLTLGDDIVNDIVNKLHQQLDCYNIL